jgi:hypothetical protein
MFIALSAAALAPTLGSGTKVATSPPASQEDLFLSPAFVQALVAELTSDALFGPILRGASASPGSLVDRTGAVVVDKACSPKGGAFLVRCGLLYRRGPGTADRLCIPAGGGLRAQVLRECHDGPLGGHFGRTKTGSLVRRPSGSAKTSTSPSTCAHARPVSAPRPTTVTRAAFFILFLYRRGAAA